MSIRIKSGKFLLSLGEFIKSLAVVMMRPEDLIRFGKRSYSEKSAVSSFSNQRLLKDALGTEERKLLEATSMKSGKILVLGVGGGREAIEFSRMGFDVTGTDFVDGMCKSALINGEEAGVKFKVFTQEMSDPDFPPESFDIVWLSTGMYSAIASKKKRIDFLRKIKSILRPGGFFLLQFHWKNRNMLSPFKERLKKVFSFIFFRPFSYQSGDSLWRNKEFIHFFHDDNLLRSELNESGMNIITLDIPEFESRGNAVLKKTDKTE